MTAQEIFECAMVLMDGLNYRGEADTDENQDYKYKALTLINLLAQECYLSSDTYDPGEVGSRPTPEPVEAFSDTVDLDEAICRNILPYGVAAHLLLAEGNTAMASFVNQKYQENLQKFKAVPRAGRETELVYGGIEYGADGLL
ncbi:hypothetical protein [Papillibacter cinnamivorans]|uniref:Uncharacterized protein n=1 Tax=Papillibacter cinnamivorans DSM 12816 TaxID=1122930 RepID=A0A1W2C5P6_9FIRM|nr:hypothetical protein [Papillibacter cinnamivorans]SMC80483.1 hypothetical protein SAMN02745168_2576 [Papillibacter cinnamivorans DSM 12816]